MSLLKQLISGIYYLSSGQLQADIHTLNDKLNSIGKQLTMVETNEQQMLTNEQALGQQLTTLTNDYNSLQAAAETTVKDLGTLITSLQNGQLDPNVAQEILAAQQANLVTAANLDASLLTETKQITAEDSNPQPAPTPAPSPSTGTGSGTDTPATGS